MSKYNKKMIKYCSKGLYCLIIALVSLSLSGCNTDGFGIYFVGHKTESFVDHKRGRTINIDIWHPVVEQDFDRSKAKSEYIIPDHMSHHYIGRDPADLAILNGKGPISNAALDDQIVRKYTGKHHKGFPVVIYSHGSTAFSTQSYEMCEYLSSHGFIVVSATHEDDKLNWNPAIKGRMQDISAVIDRLQEKTNDPQDPFHGEINTDKIALIGESLGAATTLACITGFDSTPGDSRIKVIAPLSLPYSFFSIVFPLAEIQSITTPTLLMTGSEDFLRDHTKAGFDDFPNLGHTHYVEIKGATHEQFSSVRAIGDWTVSAGLPRSKWPGILERAYSSSENAGIEQNEMHRLQRKYLVTFLSKHFWNYKDAAKLLDPTHSDYQQEVNIQEYQVK